METKIISPLMEKFFNALHVLFAFALLLLYVLMIINPGFELLNYFILLFLVLIGVILSTGHYLYNIIKLFFLINLTLFGSIGVFFYLFDQLAYLPEMFWPIYWLTQKFLLLGVSLLSSFLALKGITVETSPFFSEFRKTN